MKVLTLSLILTLYLPSLLAQEKFDFDYKIDSKAFEAERKFYVHVPADYHKNTSDSLGVIFILDGQGKEFYNNAKAIIDYLIWSYQIPKMIVVGVHSESRYKEFIPLDKSKDKSDPQNVGQAEKLREHFVNEMIPILEKDFRINNFKAVIGHSRGGAFIANTIFSEDHDLFNAYIAISPGMQYLNRQILNDAKTMIQENKQFNNFYYCSYGSVGSLESEFSIQVNYLDSLFSAHPNESVHWRTQEMPGKTHWSVVAPSIVDGLVKMNRAYQVDQFLIEEFSQNTGESLKKQIDMYYTQQKKKLKYVIPPNAPELRYIGNEMSEVGMNERAVELFDIAIELDSNQLRTYLSKAEVLIQKKDFAAASEVYETARKMLELNKAGAEEKQLLKDKERLQERIENLKKIQE